jgi:hypothetical protein
MKYMMILAAVMVTATAAFAAEPSAPKDATLKATLSSQKESYVLNPAQRGEAFRKKVADARERGEAMPKPPAVEIVLTLTNTGNKDITLHIGGDESRIMLNLAGKGALSVQTNMMMTMEYRMGTPTKLAPGKSTEIKITSLAYGTRNISDYAYWTEPGEYTLTATLTAQTPEQEQGVTIVSEPLKVKVEAKK